MLDFLDRLNFDDMMDDTISSSTDTFINNIESSLSTEPPKTLEDCTKPSAAAVRIKTFATRFHRIGLIDGITFAILGLLFVIMGSTEEFELFGVVYDYEFSWDIFGRLIIIYVIACSAYFTILFVISAWLNYMAETIQDTRIAANIAIYNAYKDSEQGIPSSVKSVKSTTNHYSPTPEVVTGIVICRSCGYENEDSAICNRCGRKLS